MSCALIILSLIFSVSGCQWKRVDATIQNPLEFIYVRTGCSSYAEGQQLDIVFVEQGGSAPNDTNHPYIPITKRNSSSNPYGLKRQFMWSYVRLFANVANYCPNDIGILEAEQPKWKCAIAGSVDAWWVGDGAFQMSLILPASKSLELTLVRGMDGCTLPLEQLGYNDAIRCRNATSMCPEYCTFVEMNGQRSPPLASFTINMPPMQESKLSPPGGRMYSSVGYWNGAEWVSPETPKGLNIRRNALSSVCVIGDSHMVRTEGRFLRMMARGAGMQPTFVGNYVHDLNVSAPLKGEFWHPRTASMLACHDRCAAIVGNWKEKTASQLNTHSRRLKIENAGRGFEYSQTAINSRVLVPAKMSHSVGKIGKRPPVSTPPSSAAPQQDPKTGATIWWYGSHTAIFSPQELAQTIQDIKTLSHHTACTVVVGIPVAAYEEIPEHEMGPLGRYYQNPWRLRAQNDAIRKATESIPNFHYFDVYEESLALYYDGHYRGDPVHMSFKFYGYLSKLILHAAVKYCGG